MAQKWAKNLLEKGSFNRKKNQRNWNGTQLHKNSIKNQKLKSGSIENGVS